MQGMIEGDRTLILAVSGGVDSVVMLDMLARSWQGRLVIAHVNHGIRADSNEDEVLVARLAKKYGLEFTSTRLNLGPGASEDTARRARFGWLEEVCARYEATAIATAHHADDVLETIMINLSRGTGWRGLCSLRETEHLYRPLLNLSKAEIVAYAIDHSLEWREDSTNESLQYLRNRIRNIVIPRLDAGARERLFELYRSQLTLRDEVDAELATLRDFYAADGMIDRHVLIMVDDTVAIELLRAWLGEPLEMSRFRDLLLFSKTARPGAKWSLDGTRFVLAKRRELIVSPSRD